MKTGKKFQLNLPAVFMIMLVMVLGLELVVLYKYLYLDLGSAPTHTEAAKPGIDETGYDQLKTWFSQKKSYALPTSTPATVGRENPFEEYR